MTINDRVQAEVGALMMRLMQQDVMIEQLTAELKKLKDEKPDAGPTDA